MTTDRKQTRAQRAFLLAKIEKLELRLALGERYNAEKDAEIERLRAKLNSLTVPLECAECERLRAEIKRWQHSVQVMGTHRPCACAACCRLEAFGGGIEPQD